MDIFARHGKRARFVFAVVSCAVLFAKPNVSAARRILEDQNSTIRYFFHELEGGAPNSCQGYAHTVHALACGLAEAHTLNRTFLMPSKICLPDFHNRGQGKIWKPIESVFNMDLLASKYDIMTKDNIEEYVQSLLPFVSIARFKYEVPPMALRNLSMIDVLARMHGRGRYTDWWTPCSFDYREVNKEFTALKGVFMPAKEVQDTAAAIIAKLGNSFCTLHVRRGDKLKETVGLDEATQPGAILESIKDRCIPGSTLYIASNEDTPGFFEPLRANYSLFTYEDFPEQLAALGAVELDDSNDGRIASIKDNLALYQVDVEIQEAASTRLDTFCVLYKLAEHSNCANQPGKNAEAYGVAGVYGLVGR